MCSRYTLILDDGFAGRFGVAAVPKGCRSSYNVAPGRTVPVILQQDARKAVPMRWGIAPRFANEGKTGERVINARSETLAERPMFKNLVRETRCLVPASGFYEWKNEGARRVPFHIRLASGQPFSFAGLYDPAGDPRAADGRAFAIITTRANALVAPVHDRMPVILRREDEPRWLSPGTLSPADRAGILVPFPAARMEAYPVDARVNSPSVDDKHLIRPVPALL